MPPRVSPGSSERVLIAAAGSVPSTGNATAAVPGSGTFQKVSRLESWGLHGAAAVPARLALRRRGGRLLRARPARDRRGTDDGHTCPANGGENARTQDSEHLALNAKLDTNAKAAFFLFVLFLNETDLNFYLDIKTDVSGYRVADTQSPGGAGVRELSELITAEVHERLPRFYMQKSFKPTRKLGDPAKCSSVHQLSAFREICFLSVVQ